MLRHRLFDIRLVVSRALIYGVMMSVVIGALALVDWAFSRWLQESRFALVAELAMALLLGVTLTTLHRRLERFLNTAIFRAQAIALQTLRRFAAEADLTRIRNASSLKRTRRCEPDWRVLSPLSTLSKALVIY